MENKIDNELPKNEEIIIILTDKPTLNKSSFSNNNNVDNLHFITVDESYYLKLANVQDTQKMGEIFGKYVADSIISLCQKNDKSKLVFLCDLHGYRIGEKKVESRQSIDHLMSFTLQDSWVTLNFKTAPFYNAIVSELSKAHNINSFFIELTACNAGAILFNTKHKIQSDNIKIKPHQTFIYSSLSAGVSAEKGLIIRQNSQPDVLSTIKFLCLNNMKFTFIIKGENNETVVMYNKYNYQNLYDMKVKQNNFYKILSELEKSKIFRSLNHYTNKDFEKIFQDFENELQEQIKNPESEYALFANFLTIHDIFSSRNRSGHNENNKKQYDLSKFCHNEITQNTLCKVLEIIENDPNSKYKELLLNLMCTIEPKEAIDALCFNKGILTKFGQKFIELSENKSAIFESKKYSFERIDLFFINKSKNLDKHYCRLISKNEEASELYFKYSKIFENIKEIEELNVMSRKFRIKLIKILIDKDAENIANFFDEENFKKNVQATYKFFEDFPDENLQKDVLSKENWLEIVKMPKLEIDNFIKKEFQSSNLKDNAYSKGNSKSVLNKSVVQ